MLNFSKQLTNFNVQYLNYISIFYIHTGPKRPYGRNGHCSTQRKFYPLTNFASKKKKKLERISILVSADKK